MKRFLPLLGIFLLFFLVVSGFARAAALPDMAGGEVHSGTKVAAHHVAGENGLRHP
ncbi:MAG: hypothetical protein ACO1OQ_11890 [Rufibacter sp.]